MTPESKYFRVIRSFSRQWYTEILRLAQAEKPCVDVVEPAARNVIATLRNDQRPTLLMAWGAALAIKEAHELTAPLDWLAEKGLVPKEGVVMIGDLGDVLDQLGRAPQGAN